MADVSNLLVPIFRIHTTQNEAKSKKAGRPIFDDVEVCEIRFGGDRQKIAVFPAHEAEPNATRESTANGGDIVTYAMVYSEQYKRFKNQEIQVAEGTPLSELPFLTESKRRELKALNIHTAEALSAVDGTPLRQLGMGGRELKTQAQAYLDNAAGSADVTRLAADNAILRDQMATMQQQIADMIAASKGKVPSPRPIEPEEDDEPEDKALEELSDTELRAYIKEQTGEAVKGNPSHETLYNRALEIATNPDRAA